MTGRLRGTAVVALLIATGCSAGSSHSRIVLPFDAYRESPRQTTVVFRAIVLLGGPCMRRFGLAPMPAPAAADPGEDARRYGLLDAGQARRRGYHPPPASPHRASPSPSRTQLAVWTGQGARGVPAGGCAGEAERRLDAGAPVADLALPSRLQFRTWQEARDDPRVRAVFARWSACMRRAGFSYAGPMDAPDDPRFATRTPTRLEIRVATADVACKRETDLAGVWFAVEAARQRVVIATRPAEFTAIRNLIADRERAARAVLGRGTHP